MAAFSCEQCDELLPDYVLGMLSPDEAAATIEHVRSCPRCTDSLGLYEALLGRLGEAVAQHEPPAALRQQLLATIQGELAPLPPAPRLRWWWPVRIPRWAMVLTVVNAMLLLASGWWVWHTRQELALVQEKWQQERAATQLHVQDLRRELALVQEKWQQVMRQLGLQRHALTLSVQPESQRAVLRSDTGQARGTLVLEAAATEAVLIVQQLPRLQADRVYQLWLVRENIRDNGGIFQVDEHGFGMLLIHAPHPLAAYRAAGITEEPSGGSPGPTSPRVIGGPLQHGTHKQP